MFRNPYISILAGVALVSSVCGWVVAEECCCVPKCRPCCHRCRPCCPTTEESSRRDIRSTEAASRAVSGPLVQPIAMSGFVALPTVSFRAVTLRADDPSNDSSLCGDRLDELDARVEALHLRLVTIQRSVELQTKILEEIKTSGTIGGTPIRIAPKVVTTPGPGPSVEVAEKEQHLRTKESLQKLLERLSEDPEKNANQIEKVKKVLSDLDALLESKPSG